MYPRFRIVFCCLLLPAFSVVAQYQQPGAKPPASVTFRWPEGKRAALSLTFDDARASQIDNGLPLFARFSVRATFYVSPANIEQRLAGWKEAVIRGHEIGNHTENHPCTGNFPWSRNRALEDFGLEDIRKQMTAANRRIGEMLGVAPATFAYPCGQKYVGRGPDAKSYVPLVAELFSAGRGWLDEASNDPAFCDPAQLLGVPSDNLTFEQLRARVDDAIARGQWLVLAGHDIGPTGARQTTLLSTLDELLAYVSEPSRGVWVDTVAHIAAHIARQRERRTLSAAAEAKLDELLGRMTLEEKIGQMNMPCVYESGLGKDVPAKIEACRKFTEGSWEKGVGPGGGFFTLANTILPEGPRQQAEYFNELQKIALEKTRLRIPLLQTEEGTHGLMCSGGTIFPEGPALGSTWNPDLLREIYAAAAREARAVGIHQLFTLVIEPNRDPRLGRNQEGYSEDPYLCARIAETIVEGAQGGDVAAADKVVAGLCHYPGQSQPVSGLERGAMEISERALRETFLPPWVAGIKGRGALGVMATYPAIDGTPVHASRWILDRILRQELTFDGLVLSEGSGISTLLYEGLAATQAEAGALALRAGVDVGISYEKAYMQELAAGVHTGQIPVSLLDRAVRRILQQKQRLGLFERPYVDPQQAALLVHSAAHVELALRAAREGIVLLRNEGNILPLKKSLRTIAVLGPNADNARNQLGDYTSIRILQPIVTVLEGIRAKVSAGTKVDFVKGCDVTGTAINEIERARAAAKAADVAIVMVGENEWRTPGRQGTNGEGYDVASLDLTGMQEELVRAVHSTGTPTVVVLINGRPLSIRWIAENVPAILESWLPGEQGGRAVADVLFGDYNPVGRLPVTVPRHSGQLPAYYNYKPSKAYWLEKGWGRRYADMSAEPLYEFGYGLGYTTFDYSNLRIEPAHGNQETHFSVNLDIRNSGDRTGEELVQLYLRDLITSVTAPVRQLRGFQKVALKPGETRTVRMELGPAELSLLNADLRWVVEPGEFEIAIGRSAKDIRLRGKIAVD